MQFVTFADGSLSAGVNLWLAGDFAYYAQSYATNDATLTGSPFAVFVNEVHEAALAHAVRGGADAARLHARSPQAQAALVVRYVRASAYGCVSSRASLATPGRLGSHFE